jgi:hypothetical protein
VIQAEGINASSFVKDPTGGLISRMGDGAYIKVKKTD